jgi:hypothetical protein
MGIVTLPTLAFVFKLNPIAILGMDIGYGLLFQ